MLNMNDEGVPIAKIVDGKHGDKVVSVSEKPFDGKATGASTKHFQFLGIANDAKFQLVPNPKTERHILYITGPSGSGKSTFARKYLEEYKKAFKDNPIYLFSSLPDDESLGSVQPKRLRLDESLYLDPIPIKDFAKSVVIFDDIDVISDKKIREAVYNTLNQVLEIGRHFSITCLVTNHLPSNRSDTRRILNECHSFTYFPRSSSAKIKYVLTEYLGLDKRQISAFKKMHSRWVCIIKNYPGIFVSEREIGLLDPNDDDDEEPKKGANVITPA